jgi:hypothetical protein
MKWLHLETLFAMEWPMPHILVNIPNPVFSYEIRRVRWLKSVESLRRYSQYVLYGLHAFIIGWWFLSIAVHLLSNYTLYSSGSFNASVAVHNIYDVAELIITLILFANVGVTLLADAYYTMVTVNSINQQVVSGHWDILRVTPLPEDDILSAKYAISQILAWRLMAIETALRVLSIVFIPVLIISTPLLYSGNLLTSLLAFVTAPVIILFVIVAVAPVSIPVLILLLMYIFEPYWRMQAVLAFGIAVSARIQNTTIAALAGFGTLLVMRAVQVAVFAGILYLCVNGFARAYPPSAAIQLCVLPWGSLLASYLVFLFYRWLRNFALRLAYRLAFSG